VTDRSSSCDTVGAAQHNVRIGEQAANVVGLVDDVETVSLQGGIRVALREELAHPVDLVLTDEAIRQHVADEVVPHQSIGVQ
jgi:hypothetical protein